jgi:hypothetical protein
MKINICAATVAALVACGATASAIAKDKPASASSLRAIQIECLKQYGAYEDPQTKQIKLVGGGLTEFQTRVDAIYACVSQKTGKPTTPFIRSEVIIR